MLLQTSFLSDRLTLPVPALHQLSNSHVSTHLCFSHTETRRKALTTVQQKPSKTHRRRWSPGVPLHAASTPVRLTPPRAACENAFCDETYDRPPIGGARLYKSIPLSLRRLSRCLKNDCDLFVRISRQRATRQPELRPRVSVGLDSGFE